MKLTLSFVDDLSARVEEVRGLYDDRFPGDTDQRRPVHTVHVPADRFTATSAAELGKEALHRLDAHAPDGAATSAAFGIDSALGETVRERVAAKLAREPVEDLRIDFGAGYGLRDDDEEDGHVAAAVEAVAQAYETRSLPYYWGLRVKSFADGGHGRAMRTLDGFLTGLAERLGRLPGGFVVTLPKVVTPEYVGIFADFLTRFEEQIGLPEGLLRFEVQVEAPQITPFLSDVHSQAGGRLTTVHLDTRGYTAACGLPPSEQRLDHPACDHARNVMQARLAGTGVRLSDGATNAVPASDDTKDVHKAWRLHTSLVRYSLLNGFAQGWDTCAAQLPARYAAVYAFLLGGLDDAVDRARAGRNGQADGGAVDDPAAVQALVARLRRAVDCGAVDRDRVRDLIG